MEAPFDDGDGGAGRKERDGGREEDGSGSNFRRVHFNLIFVSLSALKFSTVSEDEGEEERI